MCWQGITGREEVSMGRVGSGLETGLVARNAMFTLFVPSTICSSSPPTSTSDWEWCKRR